MNPSHMQNGLALVTVLIITAVGLLFGAGALLLFQNQCQLRIDRQHEMEKVYAVRSALNWIAKNTDRTDVPREGTRLSYHTWSDRDLTLIVKPVKQDFPELTDPRHLDISGECGSERVFRTSCGHAECSSYHNYCAMYNYAYGAIGLTNVQAVIKNELRFVDGEQKDCLVFFNNTESNSVVRWVNIGMSGSQGWLQEEYGRRYSFRPVEFGNQNNSQEGNKMRFCLVRTNYTNAVGCGWPLQDGERALVFEICKNAAQQQYNVKFNEWICEAGITNPVPLCPLEGFVFPDKAYAGFQLAHNTVTLFYIDKNQGNIGKGLYGYDLLGTTNLTFGTSDYFMRGVIFEDEKGIKKTYVGDGMFDDGTSEITDDMKIVSSPDLRVVFEVKSNPQSGEDILTEFKVTPAYQYDILLEHRAAGITNLLATIAQKSGKSIPRSGLGGGGLSSSATMLTYDTHGTARKGFRTDEREAERRRNGR